MNRAGGALIVSALAHAMAAATVGAVLRSMPRAPAAESQVMDVDVVPLLEAPAGSVPEGGGSRSLSEAAAPPRPHIKRTRAIASQNRVTVATLAAVPASGESEPPARFAFVAGTVASRATTLPTQGPVAPGAAATGPDAGDAVSEGEVNVPARLLSSSPLVYPPAARSAEIEIDFPVEIVVDTEGRVASSRALTRAGYGLDEAAINAIRAYRFSPAVRAGRPVRVRMRWLVQFRLR